MRSKRFLKCKSIQFSGFPDSIIQSPVFPAGLWFCVRTYLYVFFLFNVFFFLPIIRLIKAIFFFASISPTLSFQCALVLIFAAPHVHKDMLTEFVQQTSFLSLKFFYLFLPGLCYYSKNFQNGCSKAIHFYSILFLFGFFLQVSSLFYLLLLLMTCIYECVCVYLIKNKHNLCTIYKLAIPSSLLQ